MTDSPDWIGAVDQSAPLLQQRIVRTYTLGQAPAVQTFTTSLTGGTRSIRLFYSRLQLSLFNTVQIVVTPIVGHLEDNTLSQTLAAHRIAGSKIADWKEFAPSFVLPVGHEVDMVMANTTAAFLDAGFGTSTSMDVVMSMFYQIV